MDQSLFAAPHGFSQRTTSFIASQRQGIHQMPLRRLIALISQCPDNPDTTHERSRCAPVLSCQVKITGIGKTSCKDLPLHPFHQIREGVRSGPPRHVPRRRANCTRPAPWHGKSNPFFTMSKIMSASPRTAGKSCLVSMGCRPIECRMHSKAWPGAEWWSQTGSNRRPPACKAGALPTELWPRTPEHGRVRRPSRQDVVGITDPDQSPRPRLRVVGLGRLELPTSRLSGVRSNQTELQARFACASARKPALPKATLEERETKTARPARWGSVESAPDFSIDASIARHDARLKTHP
jgi:hypothetical protein